MASAVVTEMIISASVSRLASHTPRSPKLNTPAPASRAMRQPARTPGERGGAHDEAEPGHALEDQERLVVDDRDRLLDRRDQVDEQPARGAVLDHPVAERVEPGGDVDHQALGEPGTQPLQPDPHDDDGQDGPGDPPRPGAACRRAWPRTPGRGRGRTAVDGVAPTATNYRSSIRAAMTDAPVDDAHDDVAVHDADRAIGIGHHRDQVLHDRRRRNRRAVGRSVPVDGPHDRARRQHVRARARPW